MPGATRDELREKRMTLVSKEQIDMPAMRQWALEHRMPDPAVHLDEFIDYWIGEGKKKADWNAAFRNRLRWGKSHQGWPAIARPKPVPIPRMRATEKVFDHTMPAKIKGLLQELAQKKGLP